MTHRLNLPRSAILRAASGFRRVLNSRKSLGHPLFRLHYTSRQLAGGQSNNARLGMTVSRRVSGRAVDRNRIRRQIRESFRIHRARLPALDLVVVARRAAATAGNEELRLALETFWRRLQDLSG